MTKIDYVFLACFVFFMQACASVKPGNQDTLKPSALDGAWVNTKCTCGDKDVSPDTQSAYVLFINGNRVFQHTTSRWRKAEWNKYCLFTDEAVLNQIDASTYDVETVSQKAYAPGKQLCNIHYGKLKRVWKIQNLSDSGFEFSSENGCESGLQVCSFKRLDH